MSKTRWITRDLGDNCGYAIWSRKPRFDGDREWITDEHLLDAFCPDNFVFATGIRLKPGEIAKIRFEKIEVKK